MSILTHPAKVPPPPRQSQRQEGREGRKKNREKNKGEGEDWSFLPPRLVERDSQTVIRAHRDLCSTRPRNVRHAIPARHRPLQIRRRILVDDDALAPRHRNDRDAVGPRLGGRRGGAGDDVCGTREPNHRGAAAVGGPDLCGAVAADFEGDVAPGVAVGGLQLDFGPGGGGVGGAGDAAFEGCVEGEGGCLSDGLVSSVSTYLPRWGVCSRDVCQQTSRVVPDLGERERWSEERTWGV